MTKGGKDEEVGLLVHMGGLGDVCLSESTILSITRHLGGRLQAVGNRPVLEPFREYFTTIESIDGRKWASLFSDGLSGPRLPRVVFIGKDKSGALRRRIAGLASKTVFVDMYPEGQVVHVEDYQLGQLAAYGIPPVRKAIKVKSGRRVVIYAERAYKKRKWPAESLLEVRERLHARGIETVLMAQPGLSLPEGVAARVFEVLSDIADFFSSGGIFLSNDSGMAHFAARCGMYPVTLFFDADPQVWRPAAGKVLKYDEDRPSSESLAMLTASLVDSLRLATGIS
jgi:hypothetical protein